FSVSTGSWAYQWIVNGPVRRALDVGSGVGAFGPNFHANRTIGRALGLAYKNTAGLVPGEKDMGVMGNPFKFSLLAGEREAASPWEPYHATHGYDPDDSTVTLGGPNSFIQWRTEEPTAEAVLRGMIENTPPAMIGGEQQGGDFDQTILHVLNPDSADALAAAGLDKDDVKTYVCDNSYIRTEDYQKGALWEGALDRFHGTVDRLQAPQVDGPAFVKLVTVGGRDDYNAVIGPSIGGPVTKRIEVPDNWGSLIETYARDRRWGDATT
ncbi:MAG: hypothetical protein ABEJ92_10990, partial [Halobacteriales archaeon]